MADSPAINFQELKDTQTQSYLHDAIVVPEDLQKLP